MSWLIEREDNRIEGEEGGPLSWLVKDKDMNKTIEYEEGEELSWLVDHFKHQYGCSEGKPTIMEIICQLTSEANPELSRFFKASKNFSPVHWRQNGPAGVFEAHQQSFVHLLPEKEDLGKQLKEMDFCDTSRNYFTQEKQFLGQRRHFPDVNNVLRDGSWMTFNSGATNQWEEEEKLEEMWEKSREDLEREEREESRETSDKSPKKGQFAGRTKYTSISEVPDHLDLDLEVGNGRFLENR